MKKINFKNGFWTKVVILTAGIILMLALLYFAFGATGAKKVLVSSNYEESADCGANTCPLTSNKNLH
ncbi:MAG: hypothetical protein LBM71_01425 [Elusimicrobiota bacterium]|jgi:hypothetical protein|nr:hypothetical protein [Elusimicrobiota bacterium]